MNRREVLAAGASIFTLWRGKAHAQQIEMMTPEESIALEHETRSKRLRRLVRELGITPEPEFYEYTAPASVMPADFRYDTPVLRVVFPESTFFETARTEIVPSAQPIIVAMARMLEGDVPDVAVFVAGHADNRGSEAYNYDLSVRRARAVAQALRTAGADAPDLWSVGFGESLPLYENSTLLNMSYNRRVEFLFAARPEAAAHWLRNQMDLACSRSEEDARRRCLAALKLRTSYVVDPVAPTIQTTTGHAPSRVVRPSAKATIAAPSKQRQIVINLAERTYVVHRPEL